MLTFIAFLFTIAGSVNWLLIGLLQYDYIAGFFGFQAALMSRIFYVLFGIGAVYLVLRVIINKGSFKIWERKKKKQKEDEKSLEKEGAPVQQGNLRPSYANIEASQEQIPPNYSPSQNDRAQFVDFGKLKEFQGQQRPENEQKDIINNSKEENSENKFDQKQNFSAPDDFFEPPQEQNNSQTLFDEHMNMRK